MLYETEELPEKCERQVFFNSKLDVIAMVERSDKSYVDPIDFIASPDFKPSVPITFENASDFIPFLELKIFIRPGGSLRYRVTLETDEELDKATWRNVRNAVGVALRTFSEDRSGGGGRNLFMPEEEDKAREERQIEIQARLEGARELKEDLYPSIQEEVKRMAKEGATPADIARHFEIPEEAIEPYLSQRKPRYAEAAQEILLIRMKERGLDRKLGIHSIERLNDEILNRDIKEVFPKLKKKMESMRPRLIGANDRVPK